MAFISERQASLLPVASSWAFNLTSRAAFSARCCTPGCESSGAQRAWAGATKSDEVSAVGGLRCWCDARGEGSTVVGRCCTPCISLGACCMPYISLGVSCSPWWEPVGPVGTDVSPRAQEWEQLGKCIIALYYCTVYYCSTPAARVYLQPRAPVALGPVLLARGRLSAAAGGVTATQRLGTKVS